MSEMTSMQRVLTALSHKEPDRVPFFLLLTMHGAKLHGISIREYFSRPDLVADAQLKMRERYRHDCIYGFFHAPLEVEAFGGEVFFVDDGPPNSGIPPIQDVEMIRYLEAPRIESSPNLLKVLEAQRLMKSSVGDTAPIIGVVMSPFSLPVMQLGFDRYIELLYERQDLFEHLMKVNIEFTAAWANAQLAAGSTAICYFDPVSSPTIIPPGLYEKTGFKVACEVIKKINGPTATHLASGRAIGITGLLAQTGTAALGVSCDETLAELKGLCKGKLSLIGNLNGIEMRKWSRKTASEKVRKAITDAASGGGFILSDNHGEIPFQVSDEILQEISEAVHLFGKYPILV